MRAAVTKVGAGAGRGALGFTRLPRLLCQLDLDPEQLRLRYLWPRYGTELVLRREEVVACGLTTPRRSTTHIAFGLTSGRCWDHLLDLGRPWHALEREGWPVTADVSPWREVVDLARPPAARGWTPPPW